MWKAFISISALSAQMHIAPAEIQDSFLAYVLMKVMTHLLGVQLSTLIFVGHQKKSLQLASIQDTSTTLMTGKMEAVTKT